MSIFQQKWYNTNLLIVGAAVVSIVGIFIYATTNIIKNGEKTYYSSDMADVLGFNLELVCDKDYCKWEKIVVKKE